MKIATWNVNSIVARLPNVVRWLNEVKPDVLCMQETKVTDDKFPFVDFIASGYKCVTFGQQSYNGVAIATREDCQVSFRGFPEHDEAAHARLVSTTFGGIQIVNVYIPNGQRVASEKYYFKLQWMNRLRSFFDSQFDPNAKVLLCGDFNVAPEERDVHDPRLWQGRIMCSEGERGALENIRQWGFTDAYRQHTEAGGNFTWWDYRAGAFRRNQGLRIDHIWISKPLVPRNMKTWIDPAPRKWERPSDHAPVIIEFDDQ